MFAKNLFAAVSLAACGAVFIGPAHAQQSEGSNANNNTTEIIITGSRIRRDPSFDSPVPMVAIDGESLSNSGFMTLGDALSTLPQAASTTGNQNTSATLFNSGQSRADLRGLGAVRTLVLVDGRRHITGDFRSSAVDLNMIPQTMIERVEAISGGASAVYGSEAIAGVLNITLRKRLDGFLVDVDGGQTTENDGQEWRAGFAYGTSFAGNRGSFLVGAELGKTEPIWQRDRDWAFPGVRRTTTSPQLIVPASRSNTMPTATFQLRGGATPASVSIALDRSQVFTNSPLCASATVNFACQDPWLFYTATYNALQGQDERQSIRTYADYDLTDNVKAFADLSYGRGDARGLFQPAFSNAAGGGLLPVALHGDNAFMAGSTALDAQMRTAWQAAGLAFTGTTTANVGKFWTEFGRRDSEVVRQDYRAVTGLQGKFDAWNRSIEWETYAQYGELDGYTIAFNVPNDSRVVQQTDAVLVNGQIVCRSAAAQAAGCVPWDLINGPSPQAIAWSNAQSRTAGVAQQTVVAANATTTLFDLPAGEVGVAGGLEYRRERSQFVQDALGASGALFYNAIGRGTGDYNVKEAYLELSVPILKDLPFIHRLSVELAGREGDYSTVGNVNQWRVQATWAPVQDVSFRGALSSAVRAPNIIELFAPQSQNFTTAAVDPCDRSQIALIAGNAAQYANRVRNCTAAIPGYSPNATTGFQSNIGPGRPSLQLLQGGNPLLTEETADTTTVGGVFKPRWVPDLLLSVDYWKIKVKDAINTIPINTLITNLCYDSTEDVSANRFCSLVQRDATGGTTGRVGGITQVVLINQNVQSLDTSGLDVALSYSQAVGPGRLSFRVDATKLIRWDLTGVPGGKPTHFAGVITNTSGTPNYKGSASLGYAVGNLSVNWQTSFINSFAASEVDAPSARSPFFTPDYWSHDLRATYQWNDALKLRIGVLNVFDEHPPIFPEVGNATGTATSIYDNRGRWYFVGANYSFAGSQH